MKMSRKRDKGESQILFSMLPGREFKTPMKTSKFLPTKTPLSSRMTLREQTATT
jgi:hypothetical protein